MYPLFTDEDEVRVARTEGHTGGVATEMLRDRLPMWRMAGVLAIAVATYVALYGLTTWLGTFA